MSDRLTAEQLAELKRLEQAARTPGATPVKADYVAALRNAAPLLIAAAEREQGLRAVICDIHSQHADDLCWLDIDKIFAAAGLAVPDRRVGDKTAMLANCARFLDSMCHNGKWKSYAELEAHLEQIEKAAKPAVEILRDLQHNDTANALAAALEGKP